MHTWSDVAYGFFVGTGLSNDVTPFEIMCFFIVVGLMVYMAWKR